MTIVMNGMCQLSEIVTIDGPVPTVYNQLEKDRTEGTEPNSNENPDTQYPFVPILWWHNATTWVSPLVR